MELLEEFEINVKIWERLAQRLKRQFLSRITGTTEENIFYLQVNYTGAYTSVNNWINSFSTNLPNLNVNQYREAGREAYNYVPPFMDFILDNLHIDRGRDIIAAVAEQEQIRRDGNIQSFITKYERLFLQYFATISENAKLEIKEQLRTIELRDFNSL